MPDADPSAEDPGGSREQRVDLDTLPPGWQRTLAASTNGATWELLDGRELTPDEAFDVLGRAYTSAHSWRAATGATSIESARAAWLCSRAHAVVGDASAALRLAEHCTLLTDAVGDAAADFDHVYALEARARALAALGRDADATELRARATEAAQHLADGDDRAIVESDLAAPPWFGLDD